MTTTLNAIQQAIESMRATIEERLVRLRVTGNQIAVRTLSEITRHLGLMREGELRFGNTAEPGRGFSGVRIGFPTFSYQLEDWVLAAIQDDVIQFGVRKDGTLMSLFDPSNMSAFGTLETNEMTPVIQGDFVHGLNTQIWATPVVSGAGATVDTDAARLRIQSGTSATGYAYVLSRRPVRYRAGQGTTARFTPIFDPGQANSLQLWGMFSMESNLPYDGYFFAHNGTDFGIAHYVRGVMSFVAQADWNGDKADTSLGGTFQYDHEKGTACMIKYPYLGFGNITFWIQNPDTGRWRMAHMIKYGNTTNTTQLSNPNLYFGGFILNTGNTTNMTMYLGSVGVFLSGQRSFVSNPKWSRDNYKAGITAETNLLSLRNCTTYNGTTNRGMIRLNSISVGANAAAGSVVVLRLRIGATLGGAPSYTTVNGTTADNGVTITSGNSITSVDTAGTTATGGTLLYSITLAAPGNSVIDLTPFDLFVAAGEILTISGFSTANATIAAAVNWTEDI